MVFDCKDDIAEKGAELWYEGQVVHGPVVKLRCGRCNAVLDTLKQKGLTEEPAANRMVPSRRQYREAQGNTGAMPQSSQTQTYPCKGRYQGRPCRASWALKHARVAEAYKKAVQEGRGSIVAGADV